MHASVAQAPIRDSLTIGQVIRWWELRRLLYNAALLVVGISAIAGMEWLMAKSIPLGEDAIEPMSLVLRGGRVRHCGESLLHVGMGGRTLESKT